MNTMELPNFLSLIAGRRGDALRGLSPQPASAGIRGPAAGPRPLASPAWQGDPTIAALMKIVAADRAEIEASQREAFAGAALDWTAEEVDELTDRLDVSVGESRRLSAQLERANSELRRLRHRAQRLADALGACSACWGEDSACPECQGCGRPGRSMPVEALFERIVMPAVRLMRLCDVREAPPRPESAPARGSPESAVVNLYAHALLDRATQSR